MRRTYRDAPSPGSDPNDDLATLATLRQVDLSGRVFIDKPAPQLVRGRPATGITGGMVFETGNGIVLWDAISGRTEARGAPTNGFVSDAHHDEVLWCTEPCTTIRVSKLGEADRAIPLPPGVVAQPRTAAFSPDGSLIATVTKNLSGSDYRVAVLDAVTGHVRAASTKPVDAYPQPRWSPDGRQLFYTSALGGAPTVGRYSTKTGRFEAARVDPMGLHRFVVLPRSGARGFLVDHPTTPARCAYAPPQGDGTKPDICGFHY